MTNTVEAQEGSSAPLYVVNAAARLQVTPAFILPTNALAHATIEFDKIIERFIEFDVNIADLLGMRNLSAFVGELYASLVAKSLSPMFRKNPHQDGYPDLLLMDQNGEALWKELSGRLQDKRPFSPFAGSGVEVKATCGTTPTPTVLAKRGLTKPKIGDQRINVLTGYDWKAHHQETNNLLGLFWDFINGKPKIIAVFFSHELTASDWGAIIKPKDGGGRTTSVSIMTRAGVRKMYNGWAIMLRDDACRSFFARYNNAPLAFPA